MHHIFHVYKRLGIALFALTVIVSIPFVFGVISKSPDVKQKTASVPAQISSGDCTVTEDEIAIDPEEQKFVSLINQYRQSLGLSQLATSATLSKMAAWMANDTGSHGYLAHEPDSLGRTRYVRAADCGMSQGNLNSEIMDAGVGNYDAQASFNGFKNEPLHDAEMKRANLVQIGVSRKTTVGTQGFGTSVWAVEMQPYNDGTTAPTTSVNPTAIPSPTLTVIVITGNLYPSITYEPSTMPPITVPVTVTNPPVTTYPTVSSNPTDAKAQISFKLPGVGAGAGKNNNPAADHIIYGQLIIDDNSSTDGGWTQTTFDPQNSLFTTTVPVGITGDHDIKIRSNGSLLKDLGIFTFTQNQTTTLPTVELVSGDLNVDNILNLTDYNIILSCYGTRSCQDKSLSDLNLDGKVNQYDLNIFYSGLANRSGD